MSTWVSDNLYQSTIKIEFKEGTLETNMKTRNLIYRYLVIISIALGANFANAQSFPDRPITLVVPNPPGGLVDTSARLLSEPLTRVIGQPVIVDNKPGASGNVAYQFVAKAKPDGYT
jgi:tripartite-type tricarboxylate transporter receptor subunit TctC